MTIFRRLRGLLSRGEPERARPVKVVTDSTADLPPEVVQELDITVVPLQVIFGQESFRDGIDLTSDEFFRRLAQSNSATKSAQAASRSSSHSKR